MASPKRILLARVRFQVHFLVHFRRGKFEAHFRWKLTELSVPLDDAASAIKTIGAAADNTWGLTVGTVDPDLWDAPAMQAVIVFSWEGPLWRKAFAAYNSGDVDGARDIQDVISKLRADGAGSLVHVSSTSNYTVQVSTSTLYTRGLTCSN